MKILVIEDNLKTIKDIRFYLQVRYPDADIISAGEGVQGLEAVKNDPPDLIMVDSSLPDMNHLDLISQIRRFSDVPLVVLSELETDVERAMGLEAGADEYILKPVSPIDFLAKLKALLRRSLKLGFNPEMVVSINDEISINFTTQEVFISGKNVRMTPIEYRLLSEMVRNEGKTLTHRAILEKVWGQEYSADRSFVKKYVYRLRSKLESETGRPTIITERGVGYKLVKCNKSRSGGREALREWSKGSNSGIQGR